MTDNVSPELSADNLFTAARRMVQAIRIDETAGGLLSLESIKANERLARHVEDEKKRIAARFAAAKTKS